MVLAVAAPIHQSTEIAPTPSHSVAPVTVANQLGGAAILGVLAVMVISNHLVMCHLVVLENI